MGGDVGTLLAIAEIAGLFVGFAALVTVLSGSIARHDDAFRLVGVVIISA